MKATIGKIVETGKDLDIDIQKLVEGRMLIQANSGGGKSVSIRKVLEETHGKVQHIVLDIEGEFVTLREKYGYLLVGKGGDIPLSIRIAELLARKLLELNASAIIDLSELKQHERILFVKRFLESMIDSPKELWHSCLVIIDEAHQFCPESGKCEAASAVIDLATRGRKRGFCAILATQRLSKLSKDAAAECNNKLIGRTGLDVDMKRAGDELGFNSKDDVRSLRDLEPGEFYAFGPALCRAVSKGKIGWVQTSHPSSGSRKVTQVTPARGELLKILEKLKDLPQEQEKELKTKEDLQAEIRSLRGQLSATKRIKPTIITSEADIEKAKKQAYAQADAYYDAKYFVLQNIAYGLNRSLGALNSSLEAMADVAKKSQKDIPKLEKPVRDGQAPLVKAHTFMQNKSLIPKHKIELIKSNLPFQEASDETKSLRAGAMKILSAFCTFYPEAITKGQAGAISGFSANGGSFQVYLGELQRKGWITKIDGKYAATEDGMSNAGDFEPLPTDTEKLLDLWTNKFRAGAGNILRCIASRYPQEISKEEIGTELGISHTGGSFQVYLGELRRAGLIEVSGSTIKASKFLFLEK